MSDTPYHSRHKGSRIDDAVDLVFEVRDYSYEASRQLGNGVSSGAVVGLGLPFTPARVFLQIESPSGGLVMFAVPVGAPTADGFSFYMSGETDSVDYRLHFRIVGDPPDTSS